MNYPPEEKELKEKVDALNAKWEEACPENFVSYGFYPYYTKRKYRLLFVGRETRGLSGCDYIQTIYKYYINGDMLDGLFHHRIFRFAYGLLHDFPEYNDKFPKARKIALDEFANGDLSFAFMNISTIANETGDYHTQQDTYTKSEENGRPFRREMIKILAPDVIVCANCGWDISRLADQRECLEESDPIVTEKLLFGTQTCLRFDTYHWSSFGKGRRNIDFYNNLCGSFRKFQHLISQAN